VFKIWEGTPSTGLSMVGTPPPAPPMPSLPYLCLLQPMAYGLWPMAKPIGGRLREEKTGRLVPQGSSPYPDPELATVLLSVPLCPCQYPKK